MLNLLKLIVVSMLADSMVEENENYSVDILLEGISLYFSLMSSNYLLAFERWMSSQFKPNELSAMFLMLATDHKMSNEFPSHFASTTIPADHKGINIKETMVHCVNKIDNKTGNVGDCATEEDGIGLANEISSTGEDHISFNDFVNIFRM